MRKVDIRVDFLISMTFQLIENHIDNLDGFGENDGCNFYFFQNDFFRKDVTNNFIFGLPIGLPELPMLNLWTEWVLNSPPIKSADKITTSLLEGIFLFVLTIFEIN